MSFVKNLSFFLQENTPAYGGAKGTVKLQSVRSIKLGHTSNNQTFEFPGHINTHIDFPRHFNASGKTINDYDAAFWVFEKVGFISSDVASLPAEISKLDPAVEILIFKTGFGSKRDEPVYWAEQPVIPASIAGLLKKQCPAIRVFGFDLISLTSQLDKAEGKQAHIAFLLEHDILVIEDMNLSELFNTPAKLFVAPLMIDQADGVPVTILAID